MDIVKRPQNGLHKKKGGYGVIGIHLKLLRQERHMSQAQLAAALGVNRMTVNHYELDKRAPDIDFVKQTADYFGVTVAFLMGLTEYRYENDAEVSHDRAEALYRVMEKLPQRKTQELAANLMETLEKASGAGLADEIVAALDLCCMQLRGLLYEREHMREDLLRETKECRCCGVSDEQLRLLCEQRLKAVYGAAFHAATVLQGAVGDVAHAVENNTRKLVDETLQA